MDEQSLKAGRLVPAGVGYLGLGEIDARGGRGDAGEGTGARLEDMYRGVASRTAECLRDVVEVVVEQVGVGVKRHRGRGVTEHPLNGFHIGAGADRETRRGVTEVMWGESGEAGVGAHGAPDCPGMYCFRCCYA